MSVGGENCGGGVNIEPQVFKGRVALYKAVRTATSGARDLSVSFLGLLWLEVVVMANLATCRTS